VTRYALLAVALAVAGQAQQFERPADLWIEITANGSANATLTLPSANVPDGMRTILARSIGCPASTPDASPDDYRIRARCAMDRAGKLRLHRQVRLGELTDALAQAGADCVNIQVTSSSFPLLRVKPFPASYTLSESPSSVDVDAWYEEHDLRVLGAGLFGLLLLPCLLMALRLQNLLQLHASVQALTLAACLEWTWVLQHSHAFGICALLLPQWSFAPLLALTAPPLLAVWIGSRLTALSYAKFKVAGLDPARYRRVRFWMGATLACLFSGFASLFWTTAEGSSGPFGAALASLLPAAVCLVRLARLARGGSRALPQGELRSRLFALAQRAGAPLRGVTLLTSREPRPPSARATRWGVVILSESMLSSCSRREVDAIACHELSHVGSGRSRGTMVFLWQVIVVGVVGAQFMKGIADGIPVAMLSAYFVFKLWRRREERKADLDSVRWSGDPEALITGLARVSYANHMPLEWRAPWSWFVSHPVTMQRFESIARAGSVPAARIAGLLEEARREPAEVYSVEPELHQDAAFAPDLQRRLQTRLKWYSLLAPLVIGLPVAWIFERAGLEGWTLLVGTPLAMAVFYIALELIVGAVRATARQRAAARFGEGLYVGLGLAAEPRVYNGMYHYDFGLVRISEDSFEFAGDRVRFVLDRRLVSRVWVGEGPRHFTPRRVVYVEYHPSQNAPLAVFSMQPLEARFWPNTVADAQSLCEKVETWSHGSSPVLPPPLPCELPGERGQPDGSVAWSKAVRWAGIYFAIAFAIGSLAGDPLRAFIPATLCAALAMFVLLPKLRSPNWRAGILTGPARS